MAVTGSGDHPFRSSWLRRSRARGNGRTNVLYKSIMPGAADGACETAFQDWFFLASSSHALVATGAATADPAVSSPSLSQTHVLASSGVSAATTVATPSLGQTHALAASLADTAVPSVAAVSLTQSHALGAASVSVGAVTVADPAVAQSHVMGAAGIGSGAPACGAGSLGQTHALAASSVDVGGVAIGAPSFAEGHVLSTTGVSIGAAIVGGAIIAQTHALDAASLACGAPVTSAPGLNQTHAISAEGVASPGPATGTPAVAVVYSLAAEPIVLGVAGYVLADANDIASGAVTVGAAPTVGQVHALSGVTLLLNAPTIPTVSVVQHHVVAADAIAAGAPELGSPGIDVQHPLVAVELGMTVVHGAAPLSQIHVMGAVGISASPVIGNGAAAAIRTYGLTAGSLAVARPSAGQPAALETRRKVFSRGERRSEARAVYERWLSSRPRRNAA